MPMFKARSSAPTIRKRHVEIFLNTEENISIFENTRLRVDGQVRFKALRVDADFFKCGRKNLRFQKYLATCVRGLILSRNNWLILTYLLLAGVRDAYFTIYLLIMVHCHNFSNNFNSYQHNAEQTFADIAE